MENIEAFLKDIISGSQYSIIAAAILVFLILFIILIIKLFNISSHKKAGNKILERIAKVLEQESEPYVIERNFNEKNTIEKKLPEKKANETIKKEEDK